MARRGGPVNVGLIGCGNIGAGGHLPAYANVPEARLVAVCDVIGERARQAAQVTGTVPYEDHRALLERDDVDAVDVCVPTGSHAAVALDALRAGKHVLCEKPMALTLAGCDAMIEAAQRAGVTLMVGHVRRFDHRYAEIKAVMDAGEIGRPVFVRRSERQLLPLPATAWLWHRHQGGGVILDIGVHVADLLRWYLEAEAVEVYAVGRAMSEAARRGNTYDHAFVTWQFEDGKTGFGETSWAYPGDFGGALYASVDVIGTRGKVQYSDRDTNPMLVYDAETGAEVPRYFRFMSTTRPAFEEEIRHFVRRVLDGRPPKIGPHDARMAVEMALAARRSADLGQPVTLPLAGGENDD